MTALVFGFLACLGCADGGGPSAPGQQTPGVEEPPAEEPPPVSGPEVFVDQCTYDERSVNPADLDVLAEVPSVLELAPHDALVNLTLNAGDDVLVVPDEIAGKTIAARLTLRDFEFFQLTPTPEGVSLGCRELAQVRGKLDLVLDSGQAIRGLTVSANLRDDPRRRTPSHLIFRASKLQQVVEETLEIGFVLPSGEETFAETFLMIMLFTKDASHYGQLNLSLTQSTPSSNHTGVYSILSWDR